MCWTVHLFAFCYGRWHVWTEQQWLTWYPLLNAGMVLVAQVFYAERAYKLAGRGKWVVVLVLIPLLMSLAGAFGIVVEGMRYNKNFYGTFGWLWIVNLFVADFIVSFIVLWILFNERKSAEWQSTGHMIKRLIRIACESQLPPTILALALLIDFAVQGDTYYAVFFEMIQGKVYVLGMLYVLNSRFEMRKSARRPVTFGGPQYSGNSSTAAAVIHVQSDTYVEQHELKSPFSSTNRKILPRIRDASEDGSTPDLNSRIPEKQGDYPFGAIP
jgi:hypothetical protein